MKLLTLKKNSMTRIQKYTIPTLMSCVVFAIGTLFDSFWEPFFVAGFSLQAFTYLGLCRFLGDNKAKGPFSLLFNAHLVMVIALALLFYFVSGNVDDDSAVLYTVYAVALFTVTGGYIVSKIVAGAFIVGQRQIAVGSTMILSAIALCYYFGTRIVNFLPEELNWTIPKALCLTSAAELITIMLSTKNRERN